MKKILIGILLLLLFPVLSEAATRYVDQTAGACAGNYSIASRNCSGTDGYSYATIPAAITAMSGGDTIYMRGGTYNITAPASQDVAIPITEAKNGTAWTAGNYSTLASYPGEWAILDGSGGCGARGVLIGAYARGEADINLSYWLFERFEIKNAIPIDSTLYSWGIFWYGGPAKFRYLYIHDNRLSNNDNGGGFGAYHPYQITIEYSYFYNNGTSATSGDARNPAHIIFFSDYNHSSIITNGYDGTTGIRDNNIQYNYFHTASRGSGFKHKAYQALTGRNPTGGHPVSDTYASYGDNIHHNIFYNNKFAGIFGHQDFLQAHHNIIDGGQSGIMCNYEPDYPPCYKSAFYNNTVMGITDSSQGSGGGPLWNGGGNTIITDTQYYGYDLNNILDGNTYAYLSTDISVYATGQTIGGYKGSNNFIHTPHWSDVYTLIGTGYTVNEYNAQTSTIAPRQVWSNSTASLFTGSSGATKYIPYGAFVVGDTTVASGGIGGAHPYLAGVTIPSHLGAVNPSDYNWVAGVLALDATYMTSVTGGTDPSWIEGNAVPIISGCVISGGTVQ